MFICLRPRTPYPPPLALCKFIYSILVHTGKVGGRESLKGLSHEIDFKNVDENGQILALRRAAAGF
jgi:hypothetical protein